MQKIYAIRELLENGILRCFSQKGYGESLKPTWKCPKQQKTRSKTVFLVVGRGRFELPKSVTSDLQSDPFGRSGIFPYIGSDWPVFALELVIGIEPTTCWLQISCSASWATPARLVPRGGIEPPTQGFSVPCSTDWATEAFKSLLNSPHMLSNRLPWKGGDPERSRTVDLQRDRLAF